MPKHRLLLGSLVPALLLGGCMGTENRGLESVHQPVVTRNDYALDLATSGGGLAAGEQRRLVGWMSALHVGYGDRVAIDDAGAPAARVHEQVGTAIASYGLLLGDDAPVSNAPITPGTVRIVISRMKATVPGCPDWSRDESHEFNSNTSSNYGCAMRSDCGRTRRRRSPVNGSPRDRRTRTASGRHPPAPRARPATARHRPRSRSAPEFVVRIDRRHRCRRRSRCRPRRGRSGRTFPSGARPRRRPHGREAIRRNAHGPPCRPSHRYRSDRPACRPHRPTARSSAPCVRGPTIR